MDTGSYYISYQHSRIHYRRGGEGQRWLFCFHGYGEDAESFDFLVKQLGSQFTLIAIDLPYHGKTEWKEGLFFDPLALVSLIHELKPAHIPMQLMGYSMGGRVALQLYTLVPHEISGLFLFAPDGLHRNPWQRIATNTKAGNHLFKFLMQYPGWILYPLRFAGRIGLYNRNLLRFIDHYLGKADERSILYKRWTTLRYFKATEQALIKALQTNPVRVELVFGRYDNVIPAKHGIPFRQEAGDMVRVTVWEAGHQLLKQKHHARICELLVQ